MPAETHVTGGPSDRAEVLQIDSDRLADIHEIEPSSSGEGDAIAADIEAD